ncbi:MAK10-like protein [Tanacetum coccineum]
MVISSPCLTNIKIWLVQTQMAFGKDFSNPFIADSLLKTIWFSTHHASHAPCYSNEALAIPEQTATGKEISNPFMTGGVKHMNALVDQGFDVNIMPLSTYKKLIDKRPAEMDIILSLASHSYIYPLGIAEDVLVDVAGYVYPVDFVILDIKEDEKRPFIIRDLHLDFAKSVF